MGPFTEPGAPMDANWFQIFADLLLLFHTLLVAFVIFGLVATLVGYFRQWNWVRNLWFRLSHLMVIGIVVLQAWLGVPMCQRSCRLNISEDNHAPLFTGT